jgi:glycosyltransferase involved in cell wall biosynthesis
MDMPQVFEPTPEKKLHIAFAAFRILHDWSGVERLVAELAAAMLERGHRVSIVARAQGKAAKSVPVTPLPTGCQVVRLDLETITGRELARKTLGESDFDVIVGMFGGRELLWMPWLLKNSGIPLILGECLDPEIMTLERMNPYEHYGAMIAADSIQVLLPPFRDSYPPALRGRVEIIGNPAPPERQVDWQGRLQKKERTLLGLGRFEDNQKRFTLLLRAWALLHGDFPQWSLKLVGDGPNGELYNAMAHAMPGARVRLIGAVADPNPHYADADLFCMPSRHEGFGLVLTEAAAHGLPLVGLSSCTAARELILPGCGALAEADHPAALAEALEALMAMPAEEREAIGRSARRSLGERFQREKIFCLWEALFYRAAERRGRTRLDQLDARRFFGALLAEAALEIADRPEPLGEESEEHRAKSEERYPAAALARLRCELDAAKREYGLLQKKHMALQGQFQSMAARAGHRRR